MVEDLARDGMQGRQLFEHVGVGGEPGLRAAHRRQGELREEQLLQLLRRAEVDVIPRDLVDLGFEHGHGLAGSLRERGERGDVEADAVRLDRGQHERQWTLELVEDLREPARLDGLAQALADREAHFGLERGVRGEARDLERLDGHGLLAAAGELASWRERGVPGHGK